MGGALYGPLALLQGGQPLGVLPLQGLQLLQLVRQRLQGGQPSNLAARLVSMRCCRCNALTAGQIRGSNKRATSCSPGSTAQTADT